MASYCHFWLESFIGATAYRRCSFKRHGYHNPCHTHPHLSLGWDCRIGFVPLNFCVKRCNDALMINKDVQVQNVSTLVCVCVTPAPGPKITLSTCSACSLQSISGYTQTCAHKVVQRFAVRNTEQRDRRGVRGDGTTRHRVYKAAHSQQIKTRLVWGVQDNALSAAQKSA